MTKEYTKNLFFDNEISQENENTPFSLEAMVRSAAQKMIQGALELEVEEFLQRGRYDKTKAENFRGYRGRVAHGARGGNGSWRVSRESSKSFG